MKNDQEFIMGMFDHVRCEVPLPRGDEKTGFQTKDLDCVLETLVIAAGKPITEDRPDFHGFLEFYTFDPESRQMLTYQAKYTDGVLISVSSVEDRYSREPGVVVWPPELVK